ncbi:MAG: colicin V production CvpA [Brevundimonas sp.]|uniref:CvpA family protein n=1 Tax=Brevundimonas albigilva TaxID=1312364 RepID=A0ABY4SJ43_9CAUL|nr:MULTISPECIES: CvpA family protein [Brevundimonas]MCV0415987.1 CvpA family protein [Brevundimonas sp.]PZU57258.1 MAG: colicin V production CvpA [Brevundimonas sp.]UQV17992.1 CvpA family protein [Brevundimonas albigilva]URI14025.1 CvpA family protein [Brevundimonas albigilva]
MTGYDVFVIVVLLFSAAAGWVRGGVREIVTLLSALLAALVALIALPFTAMAGRAVVDPDWAGTVLAAILTFFVVYFGLRIAGSLLSKSAKAHPSLGGLDRVLGLAVGAVRALILIGAVHLVIVAALPGERTPRWLNGALTYPVSALGARAIQMVLPGIGRGVDAISPVVDSSVRKGFSDREALPQPQSGTTSPREAAP